MGFFSHVNDSDRVSKKRGFSSIKPADQSHDEKAGVQVATKGFPFLSRWRSTSSTSDPC